jgi:thiol-disulfide isomerase/thioredoxin
VAALVVGVLSACHQSTKAGANQAPGFRLVDVRASRPEVSLADFKGKPVLVNFFGAWCVPCKAEVPLLESTHRRLGARVGFIGIDTTDSRTEAANLLDGAHVTYAAAYDPQGTLRATYKVRAMPTTFFVSPDGSVADIVPGRLTDTTLAAGLHSVGVS